MYYVNKNIAKLEEEYENQLSKKGGKDDDLKSENDFKVK